MASKNGAFKTLSTDRAIARAVGLLEIRALDPISTSLESIDAKLTRVVDVNVSGSLDTNVLNATTTALDVSDTERMGVQIVNLTGTSSTHVIQIRGRVAETGLHKPLANDPVAVALGGTADLRITGTGMLRSIDVSGLTSVDFKVVTVEGGTSTVAVHVRRWKG